jgi:Flp pilus assembly protein TadD
MRPNSILRNAMSPRRSRTAHWLASAAVTALLALSVAGCKTTGDDITGSVGAASAPRPELEWRREVEVWGARYKKNQSDPNAAMAYAQALRATNQRAQAVAVLQQATLRNPHNMPLLGAYGRALADSGRFVQALDVLKRAHTPDNPDWRILNTQGAVLDQMGRHVEAQRHYSAALKIVPDEPSVLSNLGMSYVLMKDLHRAELVLRHAVAQPKAQPKVRQNLALVIGLQGNFAEAEKIARADLPEADAAANVEYLRQMLSKQTAWKPKGRQPFVPAQKAGN